MSRYQTYPMSSRYNNVVILSGQIQIVANAPVLREGKGFKVTRFGPGIYNIILTDDYYLQGGSRANIAMCEICAISSNLPIPYSDLRAVNSELLNNQGTFRIYFLNNVGSAVDPQWGFSFNIYITNSTAAGDA